MTSEAVKQATFVICPVCDEKKCVGRYNCKQIADYIKKGRKVMLNYQECKHCMDGTKNEIGETLAFCELWDEWKNITLGDCFGNCESQEVVEDG